jgi:hypothetical protein
MGGFGLRVEAVAHRVASIGDRVLDAGFANGCSG